MPMDLNCRWSLRRQRVLHGIRDVGGIVQIDSSHAEAPIFRAEDVPFLLENCYMLRLKPEKVT